MTVLEEKFFETLIDRSYQLQQRSLSIQLSDHSILSHELS